MTETPNPKSQIANSKFEPEPAGVVAVVARGDRLLVIRRSQFVVAPHQYCFPGGWRADGENEPQALQRELHEELAARVRPLHRLWQSVTPWDVTLAWWHCELLSDDLRPNDREVASVHWMDATTLVELPDLLESNRQFLQAWQRGEFQLALDGQH